MRLFIAGSAPLLLETFNEWKERTGQTILERYGMSETVMLTSNPYTADARYANQSERRGGTVGFPLPGVSLRVQDDSGESLPTGEIGGIQVKGPNVFSGYWRMPEKTAEEFTSDGFFKTGDVGKIDERGYVHIVGRSKDLIISGGYNVYPAEIEGYINELPGVAESALIGVPHPDFGEVGIAVVISKPGVTHSMLTAYWRTSNPNWRTSRFPSAAWWCQSCPATPWAKCKRTCCVTSTNGDQFGSCQIRQHEAVCHGLFGQFRPVGGDQNALVHTFCSLVEVVYCLADLPRPWGHCLTRDFHTVGYLLWFSTV
jgi:acyl-CoA synthetase (AMP-forming)/AMP-acid ligase II